MNDVAVQCVPVRHDWGFAEVESLFALPFNDLLFRAHQAHRAHHDPNAVQISTLLNIKTGGCSENCGYCSQSAHHDTGLERDGLMALEEVLAAAKQAKAAGASRFCMGAAWRNPKAKDLTEVIEMVKGVKSLGLETCVTLGMLERAQAEALKEAGLDYYNHNLDTSREYYERVVTTHNYDDRLETLKHVRDTGLKVCAGGIVGMGEARRDRINLLVELANLPEHPHSVPINRLVKVGGTPMAESADLDLFEFVRTIAVARLLMPASRVRLSAGREGMSDEAQALCFFAGANSIFYGEKLLTTSNASADRDQQLFERLDIHATLK